MKTGWIVGAYAASPTRWGWNVADEQEYLDALLELPDLRGLEVPFTDDLHKYDEAWFLNWLPANLDVVITAIPGTTARVKENPYFGLASRDAEGRQAAVDLAEQVRLSIDRLNQHTGRASVIAVQFHSAPGPLHGGAEALSESLKELGQRNWFGAHITVEHCDAFIEGQPAEKGYLALNEELGAISTATTAVSTPFGVTINWGRSAIETRSAEGPLDHIQQAVETNMLSGVMFSGATPSETRFGRTWGDVHVPPAPLAHTKNPELLEPDSLMTYEQMSRCLQAASRSTSDVYLGLKIAPLKDVTVPQRVATVAQSLEVLSYAFNRQE